MAFDYTSHEWRSIGFGGSTVTALDATSAEEVWVALATGLSDDRRAVVYVTRNLGRTWTAQDAGLADPEVSPQGTAIVVDPSDPNHVLAGVGARVARTADGGATWQDVLGASNTVLDMSALAVSSVSGSRVWAGGGNLSLGEQLAYRSDDGGVTWVAVTQPGRPGGGGVSGILPHHADAAEALVAVNSQVLRTTDSGVSWQEVLSFESLTGLRLAGNDTIVVAVANEHPDGTSSTTLGLYWKSSPQRSWDTVGTPGSAHGGTGAALDHRGQLVVGTRQGVWLIQHAPGRV